MEDLYLSNYLQLTLEFEKNPTDEAQQKIQEFLSKLSVKDYMPMKDKSLAIMSILYGLRDAYDVPGGAVTFEISKVVKGLLGYCTNLVNDLDFLDTTMGVYDAMQVYGLIPAIKGACKEDYELFTHMLELALNINNIRQISDTAALFDDTEYDKWVDMMHDLKTTLTPEVLQGLIGMQSANTESMQELGQALARQAIKDADSMMLREKEKERAQTIGGEAHDDK